MENERLISEPKLVITLAKQYHGDNGLFCYDKLMATIADAPTVDAEEVVRCKDCKSAEPYTRMDGKTGFYCKHQKCTLRYGTNWERLYMPIKEADDFCSYGERRIKMQTTGTPCRKCKHWEKRDWEQPCCWCISNEDIALAHHNPNHLVNFVKYEPKEEQPPKGE